MDRRPPVSNLDPSSGETIVGVSRALFTNSRGLIHSILAGTERADVFALAPTLLWFRVILGRIGGEACPMWRLRSLRVRCFRPAGSGEKSSPFFAENGRCGTSHRWGGNVRGLGPIECGHLPPVE